MKNVAKFLYQTTTLQLFSIKIKVDFRKVNGLTSSELYFLKSILSLIELL